MDAPYGYPHVLDALSFQEFYFPKTAIMDAPSFHEIPWKLELWMPPISKSSPENSRRIGLLFSNHPDYLPWLYHV